MHITSIHGYEVVSSDFIREGRENPLPSRVIQVHQFPDSITGKNIITVFQRITVIYTLTVMQGYILHQNQFPPIRSGKFLLNMDLFIDFQSSKINILQIKPFFPLFSPFYSLFSTFFHFSLFSLNFFPPKMVFYSYPLLEGGNVIYIVYPYSNVNNGKKNDRNVDYLIV